MSTSIRRSLDEARRIADAFVGLALAPVCTRVEIAGSIRRRAPTVGDVEVVAIPDAVDVETEVGQAALFGPSTERRSAVWQVLDARRRAGRVKPFAVVDGVRRELDDARWREKRLPGAAKMLRLWLPASEIVVDLFLVTPETWGAILAIRTGSADYSAAVMRKAVSDGRVRVREGRVRPVLAGPPAEPDVDAVRLDDGTWLGPPVPTSEEADYFAALGVRWVEPEDRKSADDVRSA